MDVKSGKANLFFQAQQATSSEDKITEEKKTTAPPALIVSVIAEKKAPVRLSNRLDQKLKTDFAQKKTNNPVLQNATADRGGQVRDGSVTDYHFFESSPGWDALKHKHNIPKVLMTGDGDDKVDIQMGTDGRIHVKVNDQEAWSGTPEQFKYLTIDTGKGKDTVTNTVDGADIRTGEGNDIVKNTASGTSIETGDGIDGDRVKTTRYENVTSGLDSLTEKLLSEN
jgi:hypothetical protein